MHDRPDPVRVLQLIGDTDVTPEHLAALALHRELHQRGVEVRTLALAPGRTGGLDDDVPAIAPGPRSLAARGQAARESRWADVVVLHAPRALTLATTPAAGPSPVPTVVALWCHGAQDVQDLRLGALARRTVTSACSVVVPDAEAARALAARLSVGERLQVVSGDLTDPDRPRPDGDEWARLLVRAAG